MTQNKGIFIGISIIISVLLVVGCTNHKALDKDSFKREFGAIGYTVNNTCEKDYDSKEFLCATKNDVPFKVYFYEFENDNEAETIYEKYKSNISNFITTTSENKETKGSYFVKTVAISEDEYIVISKLKNTLIFIAGTKDYSNEINKILENIHY